MSIRFEGIEKTRIITNEDVHVFSDYTEEDQILSMKTIAQKLVPIYNNHFKHTPIEPSLGMSPREYAQLYVLTNPCLFYFFGKFFPLLNRTPEDMLNIYVKDSDDLALLEEELFSLFKLLLGTIKAYENKPFELFINKIESTFAASEEKQKIAYRALAKACESLKCLYLGVGSSRKFLTQFLFKKTDGNELLAVEVLKALMVCGSEIEQYLNLSRHIKEFRIRNDQKILIELAKSEAVRSPWDLSHAIDNYEIKDKDALVEIAKLSATYGPHITSYNMRRFGIKDEKDRIEVAKIAFANCNERIMQEIESYEIKNPEYMLDLFLTALEQKPVEAMANFFRFRVYCEAYYVLQSVFASVNSGRVDLKFACYQLNTLIDQQKWTGLKAVVEEQILKIKDGEQQKIALTWFTHFLGRCLLEKISPQSIDYLIQQKIIQISLTYRDPLTRYSLTLAMLNLIINDEAKLYFEGAFQTFMKNNPKSKLKGVPNYAVLPLLVLSLIRTTGVSKEVCDAHFTQVCSSFKEGADTHSFKDGKYLKIYVNALTLILKNTELEVEDKEFLLEKILKEYLPCKEMESFSIDGNVLNHIMDTDELESVEKESLLDEVLTDYLFSYGFEEPNPP